MMRLSRLADYGTVALGYMAKFPDSVRTAPEVAAAVGLSPPTVSKLLKLLSRRGLLVSLRGSRGGYRLARRPERITITEVVEAVEGAIALTECGGTTCRCSLTPGCSVQGNWRLINRKVRGVLDGVTLADLARGGSRKGSPRRIDRAEKPGLASGPPTLT